MSKAEHAFGIAAAVAAGWCSQQLLLRPLVSMRPHCLGPSCSCGTLKSWREPDRWINAAKECRLSTQQKQQLINLRMECLNRLKL